MAIKLIRIALRWLGLAAVIGLFVLAIVNSGSGLDQGAAAPPLAGVGLDGKRYAFAGFGSKPAVLNFWATWCPPCLAELPEFERAFKELGDRVDFYGLAVESGSPAQVADTVQRFGLSYPIVLPFAEVPQAYRVSGYPTTIIVGPDGKVVRSHAAAIDFDILKRDLAPYLGDS